MKQPTDFQLSQLAHIYDPIKAHEYYIRKRHLKGRRKGSAPPPDQASPAQGKKTLPPHRKTKGTLSPREQQKVELKTHISALQNRLEKLEVLIKKKEATLANDHLLAKQRAKKNQTGKAKQTAAQKKQKSKQYQQTHKQQLKLKAQQKKAAGGGSKGTKGTKGQAAAHKPDAKKSIAELKALATKVKGLIAVAQTKLAAL